MSIEERAKASVYMKWAKLCSRAKYNLATSGIMGYPMAQLPVSVGDLEINGPDLYGFEPLLQRVARRYGVATGNVVTATGTTMANHLVMAAILSSGDDVLIERPTYGPILEVASYFGANILRFDRHFENEFRIEVDEVKKQLTPKTRLIVLTNLHNPSGAYTDEATLRGIGHLAAEVGARVLVDEVYLDMVFNMPVHTSFHLANHFVVTSSLTKTYGLGGLRCGWILAEPALAQEIWKLNDLFGAVPVHAGDLLSIVAFDHLDHIRTRSEDLLQRNRRKLDEFLKGQTGIEFFQARWGTVCFPKLKRGSTDDFCDKLSTEQETSVVPGRFFEMPDHFRIGIGGEPEMTATGLERLAKALDSKVRAV
jgi:aspartate/methionine/tyrosine aminotransferase